MSSNETDLGKKIKRLQKVLDILRRALGYQTLADQLYWESVARRIAAKYDIDPDDFVAVLKCESGLNPKAINKNANGTTDFGICQFNDYWYKDVISPYDALNNPELALDTMAGAWKAGRAKDWICYRNYSYQSYL